MSALTEDRLRGVLAWIVIVLLAVPVGGALWLGVAHGESPCILCWAQRTSMVLIALVALFVIRYGARPRYLGMVVLLGAWGGFMALRHSALHLARDVGQGFSGTTLGAHTYTWSWVIHWVVLVAVGALLLLLRGGLAATDAPRPAVVSRAGRFAMGLLVVLAGANAVQAFISTGPPPFIGQGDPIRLSLNPKHWVWAREELEGPISWRGSWTIPAPDPAHADADADPAHGPIAGLPILPVQGWLQVHAPIQGRITDLAYSSGEANRALVVTDRYGVYLLDGTLSRVLQHVVLDKGFSIDLSPLAGATFIGDTLAVLSTNKSYVLLRPDTAADPKLEWRHFLETDGGVTEVRRARFATVRARQQYVLSLAYDSAAEELITISIPSPRQHRIVVSRFSRGDFLLSSEFELRADSGTALAGKERSLADYVVAGAAAADGKLYAISAAYSTLLVIDLAERKLSAAYAVPGLTQPVGLTVRGNQLFVTQADGKVAVLERPAPASGPAVADSTGQPRS